jgi:hypothetical protein
MNAWILPLWNEPDGPDRDYFIKVANVTSEVADKLFDPNSAWAKLVAGFETELKDHYKCVSPGRRCYDRELGAM